LLFPKTIFTFTKLIQWYMDYTKNEFGDIIYKSKNKCGQTLNLTIQCYPYPKATHWNVVFWVGKHSKGLQHLKQTGKDGLSSLL